jgi:protein-export membrane protein SecD
MSQSWRFKIYFTLFAALVSIYVLIPTFGGFSALREEAEKKGTPTPWYVKLFPEKELNLGLDLRGGIYLELEVSVEEAINNRLDLTASELLRHLKNENIEGASAERISKTRRIRILLPNTEAMEKLGSYVRDYYRGALVEEVGKGEQVFQSDEKEESRLQSQYSELVAALSDRGDVIDVERSSGSNLFRVVLKPGTDTASLQSVISSKFPTLHAFNEPNKMIFQAADAYIEKLRADTVKQAVETIRNRIDRYGVSEPSIRQLGAVRVAVELPGVTDPDRAISIVKKAGKLEFKIVDESKSDNEVKTLVAEIRKEANIPDGYTEEIISKINEAAKGKIPSEDEILFEVQHDPVTKKIVGGTPYLLKRKAEVTGDMLRAAQVSVQNNEPYVSLSFNTLGTKAFGDLTAANIGKRLAIILDGTVSKAPVIKSAIPSGEAQITLGYGNYESLIREAEDLVLVLREGALPASLKEITKTIVGPSLGKTAIHEGLVAALIAGITVVVFMIFYYKASGLLADLALGLNVLLIMGLLSLFQATLTLPGIAGIVLTMGMALDANVIIFERIREELKSGKPVKAAVDAGFSNAFSAVVDTHLTTFLSGVVLYNFGTGPIRGFAVTLMIGVMTTLFTAYLVTRLFYEYLTIKVKIQKVSI